MRSRYIAISVEMRGHAVVGHDVKPPPPADPTRHALHPMLCFQDLICEAAWKRRDVRDKDRVLTLDRGQFRAGRAYWAKRWNWTEKAVRTFFRNLASAGIIEISGQSTGHYTNVATLCNYDKYQSPFDDLGQSTGQSRASDGPEPGQNLTKNTNTTTESALPAEGGAARAGSAKARKRLAAEDGSFERFWDAYPRKVAKADAKKAWQKLSTEDRVAAIAALPAFGAKMSRTEERYIPHGASWLNGRRFEDFSADPAPSVADSEAYHRQLARHYLRTNDWEAGHGPKPGSPGSIVSADLLAEVRASLARPRASSNAQVTVGGDRAHAA